MKLFFGLPVVYFDIHQRNKDDACCEHFVCGSSRPSRCVIRVRVGALGCMLAVIPATVELRSITSPQLHYELTTPTEISLQRNRSSKDISSSSF